MDILKMENMLYLDNGYLDILKMENVYLDNVYLDILDNVYLINMCTYDTQTFVYLCCCIELSLNIWTSSNFVKDIDWNCDKFEKQAWYFFEIAVCVCDRFCCCIDWNCDRFFML